MFLLFLEQVAFKIQETTVLFLDSHNTSSFLTFMTNYHAYLTQGMQIISLFWNTLTIFLATILALPLSVKLVILILAKEYTLRFGSYQIQVRPLFLRFTTLHARRILFTSESYPESKRGNLQGLLENAGRGAGLYQLVRVGSKREYILILGARRTFLPHAPYHVKRRLQRALTAVQVGSKATRFPRLPNTHLKGKSYFNQQQLVDNILQLTHNTKTTLCIKYKLQAPEKTPYRADPQFALPAKVRIGIGMQTKHSHKQQITSVLLQNPAVTPKDLRDRIFGLKFTPLTTIRNSLAILHLPFIAQSQRAYEQDNRSAKTPTSTQQVGHLVHMQQQVAPFTVHASDLYHGGLITGQIGMGKTTLRLLLVKLLLEAKVQVIDFDLKGDSRNYPSFISYGFSYTPGKDFAINLFHRPEGVESSDLSNFLLGILVGSMPSNDKITPPQLAILQDSIQAVVEQEGTAEDFLYEIYFQAMKKQTLLDGNFLTAAQALLAKFTWMHTSLKSIFWRPNTITPDFHAGTKREDRGDTFFFDLSHLFALGQVQLTRFFMELMVFYLNHQAVQHRKERAATKQKTCIVIDEAQISFARQHEQAELTNIEKSIVTMREYGVFVLAAGVDAELMSKTLLDVGFIAQFRSQSRELQRAFGVEEEEYAQIHKYQAMVRRFLVDEPTQLVEVQPFSEERNDHQEVERYREHMVGEEYFPPFVLSREVLELFRAIQRLAPQASYSKVMREMRTESEEGLQWMLVREQVRQGEQPKSLKTEYMNTRLPPQNRPKTNWSTGEKKFGEVAHTIKENTESTSESKLSVFDLEYWESQYSKREEYQDVIRIMRLQQYKLSNLGSLQSTLLQIPEYLWSIHMHQIQKLIEAKKMKRAASKLIKLLEKMAKHLENKTDVLAWTIDLDEMLEMIGVICNPEIWLDTRIFFYQGKIYMALAKVYQQLEQHQECEGLFQLFYRSALKAFEAAGHEQMVEVCKTNITNTQL